MSAFTCYFCGGKDCKYENWKQWEGNCAVDGLYSTWITERIMAMARPCTRVIKEHNLAQKLGVTAIFNLQENGEHASCGDGIEPESGFSYKPEDFMNNGIFYYNFGWKDMTAPDLGQMLNIVQVMHFSLTETSSKIAVHCHAGLGRTGLAICCYLLYSNQMGAEEALKLVRSRRPSSVQNRRQTDFLTRFEKYIVALRITFPTKSSLIPYSPSSSSFSSTTPSSIFTKLNLASIMRRQRLYNHGVEHRQLKFVPKIVFVIVTKLVKQIEEAQGKNTNLIVFDCIANFRVASNSSGTLPQHVCDCRDKINAGIWTSLTDETDVLKLIEILLYWLLSLREPIISDLHFPIIDRLSVYSSPRTLKPKLAEMEKETFHTINFLMDLFRAKDQLQNSNSSPNSSSSADIELSALTGLARTLLGQTTLSKSTINANSNGGHGISIGSNNSDDSRTDLVVKFLTALRSVCSTSHEFSLNASPISGDDLTRDYEIESRTEEMLEVIALKEDEKEKVGGENVVTTPKSPRFMIPPSSPSSVIKSPLLQNTPLLVGGRKTNGDELDKLLLDSK